ncbi:UNVERIFIED_CONTAM: hypothetical protein HDU68_002179 [Siphonaria sp. JEL0065]|nr:hypothetical protein HDU68_002179 [Siphonaria sp. JEL0065]
MAPPSKRFKCPSIHVVAIAFFSVVIIGGLIGLKLGNDIKTEYRKNRFAISIGNDTTALPPFNGPQPAYCDGIPFSLVLVAVEVYSFDIANGQMKLATQFLPCGTTLSVILRQHL